MAPQTRKRRDADAQYPPESATPSTAPATSLQPKLQSRWSSLWLLLPSLQGIVFVTGIYVFFLAFGYFQESVFKIGTAPDDLFRFPILLVALLCFGNVVMSGCILLVELYAKRPFVDTEPPSVDDVGRRHTLRNPATKNKHSSACNQSFWHVYLFDINPFVLREVALSSVTYVLSMLCTNYALSHVNYPTQVLVKSAKTVPVVLGGVIFFKKRYPVHDYVTVATVTLALIIFNLSSKGSSKHTHQTFLGLALLGLSLFCDSMTGPRQDRLFTRVKISSTHLMFLTNIFATLIGFTACGIFEAPSLALAFLRRYPEAISQIIYFCISAALGQLFIFGSLTAFGSLHLTLITTTRKFFTVLLSVLFFGHPVSSVQWLCVVTIFISLGLQSYYTKKLKLRAASVPAKKE